MAELTLPIEPHKRYVTASRIPIYKNPGSFNIIGYLNCGDEVETISAPLGTGALEMVAIKPTGAVRTRSLVNGGDDGIDKAEGITSQPHVALQTLTALSGGETFCTRSSLSADTSNITTSEASTKAIPAVGFGCHELERLPSEHTPPISSSVYEWPWRENSVSLDYHLSTIMSLSATLAHAHSQMQIVLPEALVQQTLIPSGYLARVAQKCNVRIDMCGELILTQQRQLQLNGTILNNALAIFWLQACLSSHLHG